MTEDESATGLQQRGPSTLGQRKPSVDKIGQQTRKRIGSHLRAMYESMVEQPVPSRFTDLIAKLDDRPNVTAVDEA